MVALRKPINVASMLLLGGCMVVSAGIGIDMWNRFDELKEKKAAPSSLMFGVVIMLVTVSLLTVDIWGTVFKSILQLGMSRLILSGALVGIVIFLLSIRAKFMGEVRYSKNVAGKEVGICADGTEIYREPSTNCDFDTDKCGNQKIQTIWDWWQVPVLAIGGTTLTLVWLYLMFAFRGGLDL